MFALIPHISEKAYATSIDGVYVFKVEGKANKDQIAKAIEAQYGVIVTKVNVLNREGKKARSIRLGGDSQRVYGRRNGLKKAYVTVKKGDVIQIEAFQEVTQEASK